MERGTLGVSWVVCARHEKRATTHAQVCVGLGGLSRETLRPPGAAVVINRDECPYGNG